MRRGDRFARDVLAGDTVTVESASMALEIKRQVECTRGLRCDWSYDRDTGEWTLKLRDREAVR